MIVVLIPKLESDAIEIDRSVAMTVESEPERANNFVPATAIEKSDQPSLQAMRRLPT